MNIELVTLQENEDGSADCSFTTDKEGKEALLRYGLIAILKEAIAQGNTLAVPEDKADGG
jgi:hypothetical protein